MLLTTGCIPFKFLVGVLLIMSLTLVVPDISYAQNHSNGQMTPNSTPGHRQIPSTAVLGQMQTRQANVVAINGTDWLVSPGATVRNERNLLTNLTALYSQRVVRYTVNSQGMVDKIWILDEQESSYNALENAGVEQPSRVRQLVNDLLNALF